MSDPVTGTFLLGQLLMPLAKWAESKLNRALEENELEELNRLRLEGGAAIDMLVKGQIDREKAKYIGEVIDKSINDPDREEFISELKDHLAKKKGINLRR